MPALSYLGSLCTGHGQFKPRPSIAGSGNVQVNGKGVLRFGDAYDVHCKGSCHPGTVIAGSSTVMVNGQPAARIGDMIGPPEVCSSAIAQGSPNVIAG